MDEVEVVETPDQMNNTNGDCDVKEVQLVRKPMCPIDDGYCHFSSCEECKFMYTEDGVIIHIRR